MKSKCRSIVSILIFSLYFSSCSSMKEIMDADDAKYDEKQPGLPYKVSYSFRDSIKDPKDFYTIAVFINESQTFYEFIAIDCIISSDNNRIFFFRSSRMDKIIWHKVTTKMIVQVNDTILEFDYNRRFNNITDMLGYKYIFDVDADITPYIQVFKKDIGKIRFEIKEGYPVQLTQEGINNLQQFISEMLIKEYIIKY